jgi:hypothetical protein
VRSGAVIGPKSVKELDRHTRPRKVANWKGAVPRRKDTYESLASYVIGAWCIKHPHALIPAGNGIKLGGNR